MNYYMLSCLCLDFYKVLLIFWLLYLCQISVILYKPKPYFCLYLLGSKGPRVTYQFILISVIFIVRLLMIKFLQINNFQYRFDSRVMFTFSSIRQILPSWEQMCISTNWIKKIFICSYFWITDSFWLRMIEDSFLKLYNRIL